MKSCISSLDRDISIKIYIYLKLQLSILCRDVSLRRLMLIYLRRNIWAIVERFIQPFEIAIYIYFSFFDILPMGILTIDIPCLQTAHIIPMRTVKISNNSLQVQHLYESFFLLLKKLALSEVQRYVFFTLY